MPAIRLASLEHYKLNVPAALVSMAAETLTMMAVGAVLGGVLIAFLFRSRPEVALVAGGLALAAGIPVTPPALKLGLHFLQKRRASKTNQPVDTS
ncbi:MAG: hypothetical protein ACR2NU_12570, partial [Aeoliella sp.]